MMTSATALIEGSEDGVALRDRMTTASTADKRLRPTTTALVRGTTLTDGRWGRWRRLRRTASVGVGEAIREGGDGLGRQSREEVMDRWRADGGCGHPAAGVGRGPAASGVGTGEGDMEGFFPFCFWTGRHGGVKMEGKKSTLHQDWWRGRAEVVVSGRTWRARTQGEQKKDAFFFSSLHSF